MYTCYERRGISWEDEMCIYINVYVWRRRMLINSSMVQESMSTNGGLSSSMKHWRVSCWCLRLCVCVGGGGVLLQASIEQ
jgi:hypothetical protein